MDTDGLIQQLVTEAQPTPRLAAPWRRTLIWLAVSVLYVAAAALIIGIRPGLMQEMADTRFLVEQGATLATSILAAFAAFSAVVPGRPKWLLLLPLIALGVWLGALGWGCVLEWTQSGGQIAIRAHWICVPSIIVIGAVPAALIAVMLRRGAPIYPHAAIALGGLASAALGNIGLWTFHAPDVGVMVLVWHMGTVAAIAAIAGWLGPRLHNWSALRRR